MFEDMEEPTVEIAGWTTAREEALKKVTDDTMAHERRVVAAGVGREPAKVQ